MQVGIKGLKYRFVQIGIRLAWWWFWV